MLPLMNAAQQAEHEVVVATGADFPPEVQRHGFRVWSIGPPAQQMRAQSATADQDRPMDPLAQMVEAGTRLFGRPGIARAQDLIPLATDWQPDVVVHELTEAAGWQAAAVSGAMDVIHGFGTHIPYLIEAMRIVLSEVRSELGREDRSLELTEVPYVDPCPPLLQPPGGTPFRNVLPLRPKWASSVRVRNCLRPCAICRTRRRSISLLAPHSTCRNCWHRRSMRCAICRRT